MEVYWLDAFSLYSRSPSYERVMDETLGRNSEWS